MHANTNMYTNMYIGRDGRLRVLVVWTCVALFFLRVIGQVEVLLLSPIWLPPMEDWYSGLLPYPLLLPLQIVILMLMAVGAVHVTWRRDRVQRDERWPKRVRVFALVYFAVMLMRLVIGLMRGADDVIAAGGIPIAFHWVLALYLLAFSRACGSTAEL